MNGNRRLRGSLGLLNGKIAALSLKRVREYTLFISNMEL
ncbi:hypothetical protein SeSPB_B0016 [Salmonella enterica subsp. enterica serovar Saintpaul str. SARA29]|nr:hypothetical protein SeSPB_B0016 [Salmonella enterica subsp. enterica serovar Saintpaul str. SARA29]